MAARDDAARDAVLLTLRRIAEGGLYDPWAGDSAATDNRWMIPHFQQMLYDNGPPLRLYAPGWQLTGETLFRQVCEETAAWLMLMREMQASEGGSRAAPRSSDRRAALSGCRAAREGAVFQQGSARSRGLRNARDIDLRGATLFSHDADI